MNSSNVEPRGTVVSKILSSNARRGALIAAAIAATAALHPATARAKTFDNSAATLRYDTATNWSDDALPTTADPVVFDNSSTTLTGTSVLIGSTSAANSWTLGSGTGPALGAFTINTASATGRGVTLGTATTGGGITVDASVTGAQTVGSATSVLTFTSGTGTLALTNNSTTQTLTMGGNSTYAAGTNLSFSTAGGAINVDANQGPTVILDGGTSNVLVYKSAGAGRTLTLGGATSSGNHTFGGIVGGTATVGSSFASFGVTVNGGSTFVQALTGNNNYGGSTTVTAGTLLVNGAQTGAGSVAVNGGAIGGSGSIANAAVVVRSLTMAAGTKLTPGVSAGAVGTFTVAFSAATASTVDLSAASNNAAAYVFDLATPAASDKFVVTAGGGGFNVGTLDFADFSFNALSGFGEGTYVLFDGNSNATTAGGHSLVGTIGIGTGTIGGFDAALSIDATNDDVILTVTSVPEPATLGVLGAMVGLGLSRRRRV